MPLDAILAIDAGTTGVTALLVDRRGGIVSRGYREITPHYPRPGWVEHDPLEIWQRSLHAAADALARAADHHPIAIGVANQRETMLFWDLDGRPLHRAIVWQCRRSAAICDELRAAGLEPGIAAKTGLRLDPYFSASKALWLTREDPSLASRIAAGNVRFGTIDTWLAWQLTGGKSHVTDETNASRTLCYDIRRFDWDDGLLRLFGLNRGVMPEVRPSGAGFGTTVECGAIPGSLPIASLVGDQQAALFGQACFEAGLTKATYGTGCFILMSTGAKPVFSKNGLITTLAARSGSSPPRYALEGSVFIAGAALQWCRDNLGLVASTEEAAALAASVDDAGGVVFVPAFVGLGSPHWAPDVRGAVFGLTGATRPAHILRAALDSVVFQAQDVFDVMVEETGLPLRELRVDGGAAANDALMQLQADLSGAAISSPQSVESTALGAAYLAGISCGFWRDESEVASLRRETSRLQPSSRADRSRDEHQRWRQTIAGLQAMDLRPL